METRANQIDREPHRLRDFQSCEDDVARLIVNTNLPWVDIPIRVEQFRAAAAHLFSLKQDAFDMIYVSRFRRL